MLLGFFFPQSAIAKTENISSPEYVGFPNPGKNEQSILVISPILGLDPDKVALGRRLFHEVRLSNHNDISCASCHDLATGGADRRAVSIGNEGRKGQINSPSIYNIGLHYRFLSDGRSATLEDQIDGPIYNPAVMGTTWKDILGKLRQDKAYLARFRKLYDALPTEGNIKDAIVQYEKSLTTLNARFDRFLNGEKAILSQQELEGYQLFLSLGCVSCHQGPLLGGNLYQKLGIFENFFTEDNKNKKENKGRYNVTGDMQDLHYFKVPTLRNVALTAPYLHDGSVPDLDKVIWAMGYYQLGMELDKDEVIKLVAFLKTLTGEHPELTEGLAPYAE